MGRKVTLATCSLNQWALDFDGNLRRIVKSELITLYAFLLILLPVLITVLLAVFLVTVVLSKSLLMSVKF